MALRFGCRNPGEIAEELAASVGVRKTQDGSLRLLISAILAGVYVGFGAQLATVVTHDAASMLGLGLARWIGGIAFSIGLVLVVLAGAELFTGNILLVLSLLARKVRLTGVLRNWSVVLLGNLLGAVLLAGLVYASGIWKAGDGAVGVTAVQIADAKSRLPFSEAFVRALLCNWLVCLAVWMATAARSVAGKVFAVTLPVAAFVAMGLEHSVANMFFLPIGLALKAKATSAAFPDLTIGSALANNLVPVTLGNIVGGALFVAVVYWFLYLRRAKHAS